MAAQRGLLPAKAESQLVRPSHELIPLYDSARSEESSLIDLQQAALDEILSMKYSNESPNGLLRAGLPLACSAYFYAVHTAVVKPLEDWASRNDFVITDLMQPVFQQEAARLSFERTWCPVADPQSRAQHEYVGLILPLFVEEKGLVLTNTDTQVKSNILWSGTTALLLYKQGYSPQSSTIWTVTALFVLARRGYAVTVAAMTREWTRFNAYIRGRVYNVGVAGQNPGEPYCLSFNPVAGRFLKAAYHNSILARIPKVSFNATMTPATAEWHHVSL